MRVAIDASEVGAQGLHQELVGLLGLTRLGVLGRIARGILLIARARELTPGDRVHDEPGAGCAVSLRQSGA